MKTQKITSMFIRSFLAALVFAANCAFAYSLETNLWSDRAKSIKNTTQLASLPARISNLPMKLPSAISATTNNRFSAKAGSRYGDVLRALPSTFGNVRKISGPATNPLHKTIIHIQDIHKNAEAQSNIGKAIRELIQQKQVSAIALEGAFDVLDLSSFQNFSHQEPVRKVADYLLRENKITGPIHSVLTIPGSVSVPVVGVDNWKHYNANVKAYRESSLVAKSELKKHAALIQKLEAEKAKTFNAELNTFDSHVNRYRNEQIGLGDYAKALANSKPSGIKMSEAVSTFLEALRLESSLNFAQVDSERANLLSLLAPKLSKVKADELIEAGIAYRLGRVSHADFYNYLSAVCESHGVSLNRFPAMKSYLSYVLLADQLDPEKLSAEFQSLELAIYSSLIKTKLEKELIYQSRRIYLVGKLLDFALTREEWNEYKLSKPVPSPGTGEGPGEGNYSSASLTRPPATLSRTGRGNTHLEDFERFYKQAEIRDEKIASNLLRRFGDKKSAMVLVTGGFHSFGIDHQLVNAGYTVITFVPKITKVETGSGSAYLTAFSQQKSPLDRLFDGEKLFLSQHPFPSFEMSKAKSEIVGAMNVQQDLPSGEDRRLSEELKGPATEASLEAEGDVVIKAELSGGTAEGRLVEAGGKIEKVEWQDPKMPLLAQLSQKLSEIFDDEKTIDEKEFAVQFSEKVRYVAALGKPGSGKGTLLKRFVAELNTNLPLDQQYVILTMGDVFRAVAEKMNAKKEGRTPNEEKMGIFKDLTIPEEAVKEMESGKMLSDDLALDVLNEVLKFDLYRNAHGIFFDGFPRSLPQLKSLWQNKVQINGAPLKIDFNFILDIDDQTIKSRAQARVDAETKKAAEEGRDAVIRRDDKPEVVAKRITEYAEITSPAVEAKRGSPDTIALDGERPIDVVYKDFINQTMAWLTNTNAKPQMPGSTDLKSGVIKSISILLLLLTSSFVSGQERTIQELISGEKRIEGSGMWQIGKSAPGVKEHREIVLPLLKNARQDFSEQKIEDGKEQLGLAEQQVDWYVKTYPDRTFAYDEIAKLFIEMGMFDDADRVVGKIKNSFSKFSHLKALATDRAKKQDKKSRRDYEEAIKEWRKLGEGEFFRFEMALDLARSMTEWGKLKEDAIKFLLSIDASEFDSELSELALELARYEQYVEARKRALKITFAELRENTLQRIDQIESVRKPPVVKKPEPPKKVNPELEPLDDQSVLQILFGFCFLLPVWILSLIFVFPRIWNWAVDKYSNRNLPQPPIAGSIFSNPEFDAKWEVVFSLPIVAAFIVPMRYLFSIGTAAPDAIIISLSAAVLMFLTMMIVYVLSHRQINLIWVNVRRMVAGYAPLEGSDYRLELVKLFVKINSPLFLFIGAISATFLISSDPQLFVFVGLLYPLWLNIRLHLENNRGFMRNEFDDYPVAGSIDMSGTAIETESQALFSLESLNNLKAEFEQWNNVQKLEYTSNLLARFHSQQQDDRQQSELNSVPNDSDFQSAGGVLIVDRPIQDLNIRLGANFEVKTVSAQRGGTGVNATLILERLGQLPVHLQLLDVAPKVSAFFHLPVAPTEIRLVAGNPALSVEEGISVYESLLSLPKTSDKNFVFLGGQLFPGLSPELYGMAIQGLMANGYRVAIDFKEYMTVDEMKAIVEAGPTVIKPNLNEFLALIGMKKDQLDAKNEVDQIGRLAGRTAQQFKIEFLIVSLDSKGAVAAYRDQNGFYRVIHVVAPNVTVKSSVGAGDSLLGAVIHELSLNQKRNETPDYQHALIMGVAAGSGTTSEEGTNLASKETIETLAASIKANHVSIGSKSASFSVFMNEVEQALSGRNPLERTELYLKEGHLSFKAIITPIEGREPGVSVLAWNDSQLVTVFQRIWKKGTEKHWILYQKRDKAVEKSEVVGELIRLFSKTSEAGVTLKLAGGLRANDQGQEEFSAFVARYIKEIETQKLPLQALINAWEQGTEKDPAILSFYARSIWRHLGRNELYWINPTIKLLVQYNEKKGHATLSESFDSLKQFIQDNDKNLLMVAEELRALDLEDYSHDNIHKLIVFAGGGPKVMYLSYALEMREALLDLYPTLASLKEAMSTDVMEVAEILRSKQFDNYDPSSVKALASFVMGTKSWYLDSALKLRNSLVDRYPTLASLREILWENPIEVAEKLQWLSPEHYSRINAEALIRHALKVDVRYLNSALKVREALTEQYPTAADLKATMHRGRTKVIETWRAETSDQFPKSHYQALWDFLRKDIPGSITNNPKIDAWWEVVFSFPIVAAALFLPWYHIGTAILISTLLYVMAHRQTNLDWVNKHRTNAGAKPLSMLEYRIELLLLFIQMNMVLFFSALIVVLLPGLEINLPKAAQVALFIPSLTIHIFAHLRNNRGFLNKEFDDYPVAGSLYSQRSSEIPGQVLPEPRMEPYPEEALSKIEELRPIDSVSMVLPLQLGLIPLERRIAEARTETEKAELRSKFETIRKQISRICGLRRQEIKLEISSSKSKWKAAQILKIIKSEELVPEETSVIEVVDYVVRSGNLNHINLDRYDMDRYLPQVVGRFDAGQVPGLWDSTMFRRVAERILEILNQPKQSPVKKIKQAVSSELIDKIGAFLDKSHIKHGVQNIAFAVGSPESLIVEALNHGNLIMHPNLDHSTLSGRLRKQIGAQKAREILDQAQTPMKIEDLATALQTDVHTVKKFIFSRGFKKHPMLIRLVAPFLIGSFGPALDARADAQDQNLGRVLMTSAQQVATQKGAMVPSNLWEAVPLNIGKEFQAYPTTGVTEVELDRALAYVKARLSENPEEAPAITRIIEKWVGQPINPATANLHVIVRAQDINKVEQLLAAWPAGNPVTIILDSKSHQKLDPKLKIKAAFVVRNDLFDAKGNLREEALAAYSGALLAFSKDLVPGLTVGLNSPVYKTGFKSLEDLIAELQTNLPELRMLPLGFTIQLLALIALHA